MLLNYHIGRFVLSSLCVGDLVQNTDTTRTQPCQISDTQRTENKTTDVVIQQHSRKLLMMDILMSETCWVHKKWNKTASDIKLVLLFFNYYNDAGSNIHDSLLGHTFGSKHASVCKLKWAHSYLIFLAGTKTTLSHIPYLWYKISPCLHHL